jgi:hypothetical protein
VQVITSLDLDGHLAAAGAHRWLAAQVVADALQGASAITSICAQHGKEPDKVSEMTTRALIAVLRVTKATALTVSCNVHILSSRELEIQHLTDVQVAGMVLLSGGVWNIGRFGLFLADSTS